MNEEYVKYFFCSELNNIYAVVDLDTNVDEN